MPARSQPSRLYKYRSLEEGKTRDYTLAILKTQELRFSPASRFNDPFDCHLDLAVESSAAVNLLLGRAMTQTVSAIRGGIKKVVATVRDKAARARGEVPAPGIATSEAAVVPPDDGGSEPQWKITVRQPGPDGVYRKVSLRQFKDGIQRRRMEKLAAILDQSFGVLCLSERSDDILLWSHYASNHRGLVLEFDAAAHPAVFPRLNRVVYRQPYPKIPAAFPDLLEGFLNKPRGVVEESFLDLANVLAGNLQEDARPKSEEEIVALGIASWFYLKSSFWRYEREWRCLKSTPGPQPFPPEALTRVIVGCVETDAALAMVREAIHGTPVEQVPLYKAVRRRRRFGLKIVPA